MGSRPSGFEWTITTPRSIRCVVIDSSRTLVEKARGEVVPDPTANYGANEVSLAIGGMTCGSCAARLQGRLNALDGVEAVVNFATERAVIRSLQPQEQLLREVEAAGFTARPVLGGASLSDERRAIDERRAAADRRVRSLGRRLVVAGLLFMPLGDASIAFWLEPSVRFRGWQWVLIALALPVVTWCAWPFYAAAARNARHGIATMDTLASLGILAATGWSLYAMFFGENGVRVASESIGLALVHGSGGAIYLEVAAGVTTFLLAGRYFEARTRRRTGDALMSLAALAAKDVAIIRADGSEQRLAIEQLAVGDQFVVRAGETVATDGVAIAGRAVLDRSAMTGESTPVEVSEGGQVTGGTVALNGYLIVRAGAVGRDTQLAGMLRLVEEAQNEKAGAQRLADRIASVFVPAVLTASLLTLGGWLLSGNTTEVALNAALSVLIIACPCALGLATPMALMVASDQGARYGIFFKGYEAIEQSRGVDVVLLDKTGTVTEGKMTVVDLAVAPGVDEKEVVRLAAALERASDHPIGRAIAALCPESDLVSVQDYVARPGWGAQGIVDGRMLTVGRAEWPEEHSGRVPNELSSMCAQWMAEARTVVYVSMGAQAVAAIALGDNVRSTAPGAVAALRSLGLRSILVTGDNERSAQAVMRRCGMDDCIADVYPQEKAAVVRGLQNEGHEVAVVGDGINDGPALVRADLGLAIGSGTDVARQSADLLIVRDDLEAVPTAIRLARRTHRTIRTNLAWAFGYNTVAIPLAACGLLNPLIAAAAMALSSGFVVWNTARLRHFSQAVPVN